MLSPSLARVGVLSVLAASIAACTEVSPTAPAPIPVDLARQVSSAGATTTSGAVCETITFDDQGFTHGSLVPSLSVAGFDLTLALRTIPYQEEGFPNTTTVPRTYSTDNASGYEDVDLQYAGSWEEPLGDGRTARCPDCEGLGNVLVIEDGRGFTPWGDAHYGGEIVVTGFPAGTYWVESFVAVDDDREEPAIQMLVDGAVVARSTGLGDGTVETVTARPVPIQADLRFQFGTPAQDYVTGSGAIDGIRLCRADTPTNPGTGTPGYWKNHPEAWPVEQIRIGGIWYSRSEAIALMKRPVRGDKRYNMFEQLVAAKLNVMIGNDASCIAGTIADADAWMALHTPFSSKPAVSASSAAWRVGEPLHGRLDAYNNGRLCAPKRS